MRGSLAPGRIPSTDFENEFGFFSPDPTGDFQWTRDSGGTPSYNTGPSVDCDTGTNQGETNQSSLYSVIFCFRLLRFYRDELSSFPRRQSASYFRYDDRQRQLQYDPVLPHVRSDDWHAASFHERFGERCHDAAMESVRSPRQPMEERNSWCQPKFRRFCGKIIRESHGLIF